MRTAAFSLLSSVCLLMLACNTGTGEEQPTVPPAVQQDPTSGPQPPPEGAAVPRHDGVYQVAYAGTVQLMRFFPAGNVVTATDYPAGADSLSRTLRVDLPADLGKGIHNVPVTYRNDSVLFRTTIIRGYIDYGGVLLPGDSLRLLKHSLATAKRALLTYHFVPDNTGSAQ
jgi:hypothetical protein